MSGRSSSSERGGFTLIELVLVVAVVSLLATLAILRLGGVEESARQTVAQHDLSTLKEAFVGGGAAPALCLDLAGTRHLHAANPLVAHARAGDDYERTFSFSIHMLFAPTNYLADVRTGRRLELSDWPGGYPRAADLSWNPAVRHGWRGPYLSPATAVFTNNAYQVLDPWGHAYQLQLPEARLLTNFPSAWRPQGDFDTVWAQRRWRFARLVSAGANGRLETPLDAFAGRQADGTAGARGDDLVLFLNRADVWEDLEVTP